MDGWGGGADIKVAITIKTDCKLSSNMTQEPHVIKHIQIVHWCTDTIHI